MKHWEEIRAQWVNGNIDTAKEQLYQQSKLAIFRVVDEALAAFLLNWDKPTGTFSGDLTDLKEIVGQLAWSEHKRA